MDSSIPLANALRDIAWLLPRTLGRAPSPARLLPRSELEVMRLLATRPGLTVNEAAAELEIRPPNLSATVRALVEKGLLERRPSPTDGRSVRLHPTRQALRNRQEQERAWGAALDQVLDQLDPEDQLCLKGAASALARLAQALGGRAATGA